MRREIVRRGRLAAAGKIGRGAHHDGLPRPRDLHRDHVGGGKVANGDGGDYAGFHLQTSGVPGRPITFRGDESMGGDAA